MILACPVRGKQKSVDLCNAFVQGAPKGARGFVFYGVNDTNIGDWLIAQKSGHDWYYIDGSYFDCVRGQQFRITKNRIQVDASCGGPTDGKRFAKLGLSVKSHRPMRGYVLAVEQSPSFMKTIANTPTWLDDRIALAESCGFAVKIRRWNSNKAKTQATLKADLQGARYVLTHSSAAAIEALLDGVTIVTSEMSAVAHIDEERKLFAMGVLADNQWSLKSIKSGEAWAWLAKS